MCDLQVGGSNKAVLGWGDHCQKMEPSRKACVKVQSGSVAAHARAECAAAGPGCSLKRGRGRPEVRRRVVLSRFCAGKGAAPLQHRAAAPRSYANAVVWRRGRMRGAPPMRVHIKLARGRARLWGRAPGVPCEMCVCMRAFPCRAHPAANMHACTRRRPRVLMPAPRGRTAPRCTPHAGTFHPSRRGARGRRTALFNPPSPLKERSSPCLTRRRPPKCTGGAPA
ncbi:MAG: hypothetical protein J3K34DRAFT_410945 [Monoraphidium minutum]|nr:MAG: hypothetical protein J3K34DRAFT_410945 [Monoraphidium minutum]